MTTQATPKDYWISPSALYIERNALNNPNFIQASCVSGAQILVYVKGIIGYDAGHNYRRWPLQAAPTVFNTHSEKYIYAAIPRDLNSTTTAWVVFPSEEIDIYGKNAADEQVGDEKYYYIFLQGILTSSGDNGTEKRDWKADVVTGYLSSDEALAAGPTDTAWYEYNQVSPLVTFLKDLTMKAGTKFRTLYAQVLTVVKGGSITFEGQGELGGIANSATPVDSEDRIVTPKYVDDNALSKRHDDSTEFNLSMKDLQVRGLADVFGNTILHGNVRMDSNATIGGDLNVKGYATLTDVVVDRVHDAKSTPAERVIVGAQGFDLYMGEDGKSHLYIDYLTARTKFFAASAEVRKVSYSGGTTLFSNAGSTIMRVVDVLDESKAVIAYKCYALADDGTTKTMNWWHPGMMALCQTFNVKAGDTNNLANRYYWRLVVGVGQETLNDGKLYDYVILSNKKTFVGNEAVVPIGSTQVIGWNGHPLVFGNVAIEVGSKGGMESFATVVADYEGLTNDESGTAIASRVFYGYEPAADGGEPDAPLPYDVIVQAGDQVQWGKYGNLIKHTTSVEDGVDAANAPASAMYHNMGAPYKVGGVVNPYQWKTLTSLDSPELVLKNANNFKFFTDDDPNNIIDPITVSYEINASTDFIIRKPTTQTATPTDMTFTVTKRMGSKVEDVTATVNLFADYTTTDGATKADVPIKRLSDLSVSFYTLASVAIKAKDKSGGDTLANLSIPVLSDGEQGSAGAQGKPGQDGKNGVDGKDGKTPSIMSTTYKYAVTATAVKPADNAWQTTMPDPSKNEGKFMWTKTTTTWSTGDATDTFTCTYIGKDGENGTSVTIKGTFDSVSQLPTSGAGGDGYIINGYLWVYTGTSAEDSANHNGFTNVGKIKGEDGKSATQYYIHTAWMKAADGTGFTIANPQGTAYPYIGTLIDTNDKDSTNWRDYKWTYVKGENGTDGKTPTVQSSEHKYAVTATPVKPSDTAWHPTMPDPSKNEGKFMWVKTTITWSVGNVTESFSCTYIGKDGENGTSVTIKGTLASTSHLPVSGTAGDGYIINGDLWVHTGTSTEDSSNHNGFTNVGKIKGEDGKSATQYYIHTAWMKDADGTGFTVNNPQGLAYPYIGTLVDANDTDSSNWQDYKWTYIKGNDGADGKDGKTPSVVSTTYKYAVTATAAKPTDNAWQATMPDPSKNEGKFLWTKTTISWSTGETTDTFTCTYIGKDGKNGTSVTIKQTLSNISFLPTSATAGDGYIIDGYLWIYTGTTTEDSANHNGFTNVGKIKGEDGKSATQYYIHTAWMKDANGTDFTVENPQGVAYPYIGTLVDTNEKDSSNWHDYKWTYVKGENGLDGKPGVDGKDGDTPSVVSTTYLYAVTATPAKPFDADWQTSMPDPSKNEGKFLWTKATITWSTGDITNTIACTYIGKDGENGTSVTIKGTFSSTSQLPSSGTAGDGYIIGGYLWVYTGTTTEDSANHNGFTNVGKIKGEDGKSATQYYIHTAWMKAADGTGFTVDNPNGLAYPYIGTLVDTNEKDSSNWRDYKWTYVKGDDGLPGVDGKTPSVISTSYRYAVTTTPTKPADSLWQTTMPDPSKNEGRFLWTKTTTTWSTGDTTDTFACTYIGKDGKNGTSVTIKGTLSGTTQLPASGTAGDAYIINGYLWVYSGTTTEDSTNHNGFTNVGKIKGEDGKSATQYYIHTAWMKAADGTGFTVDNPGGLAYPYVGTLIDTNDKDSTNWRDYKWAYVKGENGKNGADGKDGKTPSIMSTTYKYAVTATAVKPADNAWQTTMPDPSKNEGKFMWTKTTTTWSTGDTTDTFTCTYIGKDGENGTSVTIKGTFSSTTQLPTSGTAGDGYIINGYLWVYTGTSLENATNHNGFTNVGKIKGEDGKSATQYYIHTAWMKDANGTGFTTTNPQGAAYPYIGTLVDTNEKDSANWREYKWIYIKGDPGNDGQPGKDGTNGTNGKDAVEFVIKDAPMVFDTATDGVVPTDTSKTSKIYVYRGGANVSTQPIAGIVDQQGCSGARVTKFSDHFEVTLEGRYIKKDGGVSVTSGYVAVQFTYDGKAYVQQVPFLVNVAKFTGTVNANNKELSTKYTELSNKQTQTAKDVSGLQTTLNGVPIKTSNDLTKYTSEIKQTAREISVEVSSEAVRSGRNMLLGSNFHRQGYGYVPNGTAFTESNLKIRTYDGFADCNSMFIEQTAIGNSYAGVRWTDVPVTGGKTYVISAWLKRMSDTFGARCSIIVHEYAGNGTTIAKNNSFTALDADADPKGTWRKKAITVTLQATTTRVNVIFCLGSTGAFSLCQPMMEEGTESNGWTLAPADYGYIMGNRIVGSLALTKNATTIAQDGSTASIAGLFGSVVTGTDGVAMVERDAQATKTQLAIVIQGYLKANTDYVLSFDVRRIDGKDDGCAFVSFVRKVLYSELYTGKTSIYSKDNGNATESGYLEIKPSGDWQRVWMHFRLSADWTDSTGKNFNIGVFGGNSTGNSIRAQFRRPKLEACAAMTEYTDAQADYIEDENISKKLRRTGIDITNERITLDAKKTTVTGDLTVQGIITDSTSYVSVDGTLWTPDEVGELKKSGKNLMTTDGGVFAPIDMTTIKSLQIQTTDPSALGATGINPSPALVALPMYDAVNLGCGVTIPAYRRSGTHVLIRNGFSLAYGMWAKSASWGDANNNYTALRQNIANAAVYICTDPRLLSLDNYKYATPTITPDGQDDNGASATAEWFKGGCFLNGRRGRWIALLPGQEIELVSVITMWQTGTNTAEPYLAWYVVGGNNMDWLSKRIAVNPSDSAYNRYDGYFESEITGGQNFGVGSIDKYRDAFFGPRQLSDDYATGLAEQTVLVTLSAGEAPYISVE